MRKTRVPMIRNVGSAVVSLDDGSVYASDRNHSSTMTVRLIRASAGSGKTRILKLTVT